MRLFFLAVALALLVCSAVAVPGIHWGQVDRSENLTMQGNATVGGLPAPSLATDAASKAYADLKLPNSAADSMNETIDSKLNKSGDIWTGDQNAGGHKLTDTGNGTDVDDAINLRQSWIRGVNVKDFGAIGDGITDDTSSIQAAANYANATNLSLLYPPGLYYQSNIIIGNTNVIGSGKGSTSPGYASTEIIVKSGTTAFSFPPSRSYSTGSIKDLSIRAQLYGSSPYGSTAIYDANTNGINLSYTTSYLVEEVSFFSLDKGISGAPIRSTISKCTSRDCNKWICYVNGSSDNKVCDTPIALHNNYHIYLEGLNAANGVDGFASTGNRFFQAFYSSLYVNNTRFITSSGDTFFETNGTQIYLQNSSYISMGALTASRAGWYSADPGDAIKQRNAINITRCTQISIQGIIERPGGCAVVLRNSTSVSLMLDVIYPYNSHTGSSAGAIDVTLSKGVSIDGHLLDVGNIAYSIKSDDWSAPHITGNFASNDVAPNFNFYNFITSNEWHVRVIKPTTTTVGAGGTSSVIGYIREVVPAYKKLYAVKMYLNTTVGLTGRLGANFFTTFTTKDLNVVSFSPKMIYDNSGSATDYQINQSITLYNPDAVTHVAPAWTMIDYTLKLM